MAQEEHGAEGAVRPEFPTARVKKIMKLDRDINKVTSEAISLVSHSAELFLRFLAEKSVDAAAEKKRKIVKLEHIRTAVKRHRPTGDFLLDSLPLPAAQSSDKPAARPVADKPVPAGTRRIDDFFVKPSDEAPVQINES